MSVGQWRTAIGKAIIPVERRWLKNTATKIEAEFEEPVIVNIGIFRGATMYCLRAGSPKAILYGIDTEYPQGAKLHASARADVIISDSGTYHKKFRGQIHFLFVDGDHSYEGVKADIAGWTPKIATGGIVAFHDFKTAPAVARKHAGIRKAILEWEQRTTSWEQIEAPGSLRAYRRL